MPVIHDWLNFNLRPAKRIERQMIVEALLRLVRFEDPARYAYIGMGAYYFSDFILMHKVLGINNMFSIEQDPENPTRYTWNRPFNCIQMKFGTTYKVLPELAVFDERPVIVWLDYYGYLDDLKLGDIGLIASKCQAGSALIVTVNGGTPGTNKGKLKEFEAALSKNYRPATYGTSLASDDKFGELCRNAITMRLQSALSDRFAGEVHAVRMRQIFNFRYRDGMQMATYGWLFPSEEQDEHLNREPKLLQTANISNDERAVKIDAPTLTFKEIAYLKGRLPDPVDPAEFPLDPAHITSDLINSFASVYRYFPSFANIEE